jgi:hypothetical protein
LPCDPIEISPQQSREQIIRYLQQKRKSNTTVDLAFYAYRDMNSCDWVPFIKAALQRNPVSVGAVESMSLDEVYAWLNQTANESIYDGDRLAQPDEVVNYKTGDGLEKAFIIANVIRQRNPEQAVTITVNNSQVVVSAQRDYRFVSAKNLKKQLHIDTEGNISVGNS